MKKIILFLSLILSGIYLVNFISAITITKNSGEVLDNSTWTNISSLTNKIDVSSNDIKLDGKLYVTGDICDSSGSCLGKGIIDENRCKKANWMRVPHEKDVYIGSSQGEGFCISPRLGEFGAGAGEGISFNGWGAYDLDNYRSWPVNDVDDTGNMNSNYGQTRDLIHVVNKDTEFSCKPLGEAVDDVDPVFGDTLIGRMKWLTDNGNDRSKMGSIDWVGSTKPDSNLSIPSIYIADCIDGVRDLGENMEYKHYPNEMLNEIIPYSRYSTNEEVNAIGGNLNNQIYQDRQKYLTAWTQKTGSHLPSAFGYINDGNAGPCTGGGDCNNLTIDTTKGEYQVACEANLLTDTNDNTDNSWIRLSAISNNVNGCNWGRGPRIIGKDGCGYQYHDGSGSHYPNMNVRFVVRP